MWCAGPFNASDKASIRDKLLFDAILEATFSYRNAYEF
jgi:hypothetical protein